MRSYLIDGYNLLYRIHDLAGHESEDLEDKRERLIRQLVGLTAGRKIKIHLVFDTFRLQRGRTDYPGVRVDYAQPSADAFLRHVISQNQDNNDLVVVSSDRKDIGNYAKACGVKWMTSPQFWSWITKRKKINLRTTPARGKEGAAPPGWTAEDDDWLKRIFEGEGGADKQ